MHRLAGLIKRLIWLVVVLAVVVIAVGTSVIGALTLRGFPTTHGTIAIAGLGDAVRVSRDAAGIAWIEAETPHDLFLAQGYVHAQDRMWQMEVWRHISAGRLSELFGSSTLTEDRFIRTLGWRQAAARDLAALDPDARAVVESYAAGVNAWIKDHQGSLSLPFVLTGVKAGIGGFGGYQLEPWTALDTLAWQKVQAWQLGGNFDSEIFRMLADATLDDPARTDELFPVYDPTMPVITPSGLKGSGGAGATATATAPGSAAAAPGATAAGGGFPAAAIGDPAAWRQVAAAGSSVLTLAGLDGADGIAGDHQVGSNNWVVGPSKTATKTALLANDPHLGIGMPSVWYMNGLRCRAVSADCPYDVVGVTFPGVPGRRPRPQREDRVGRDQRRPGRRGPLLDRRRPGQPGQLPRRRRIGPVRRPARDDQGRRQRRRPARGPDDAQRADRQRRRQPARGRPASRPALDRDRRGRRHVRGDLPSEHRVDVR